MYGTGANESHRGVDDREAAARHGVATINHMGSNTNPHTCPIHGTPLTMTQRGNITTWSCPQCAMVVSGGASDAPRHDARFTTCAMADAHIADLTARLTALTADLDAARKDSERLDWLENRVHITDSHGDTRVLVQLDESAPRNLRDAIDGARSVPHAAPEDRP